MHFLPSLRLKKHKPPTLTLQSLSSAKQYPVLDGYGLTNLLNSGPRLVSIKKHSGCDEETFNELYLNPIYRFAEVCQLQPASAADHHSGLGGLLTHTLEVIDIAMSLRKAYHLPVNADTETVRREEPDWTYGVFVAALLHDAGKLLTLTRCVPHGFKKRYTPAGRSLIETGATEYHIEWVSSQTNYPTSSNTLYELQTRLSVAMLCLIPSSGREIVFANIPLLTQVTGWLNHLPYEWGVVGEVCREADMLSVERNRKPGENRNQIVGAPVVSLATRMMRALRAEIEQMSKPLNQDGATGWVTERHVWLVCKTAAQIIRNRLEREGSTDVPTDDQRVFDILLDHGYALPTPESRPVWHVQVKGLGYSHPLTMLCFERQRVISGSRQVSVFDGDINIITRDELRDLRKAPDLLGQDLLPPSDDHVFESEHDQVDFSEDASHPEEAHSSPTAASRVTAKVISSSGPVSIPTSEEPQRPSSSAIAQANPDKTLERTDGAAHHTDELSEGESAKHDAARHLNKNIAQDKESIQQGPVNLLDPLLGRYFLTWVGDAIEYGKLDEDSPPFHRVKEGMLLVWPLISNVFMRETGLQGSTDTQKQKVANELLQKSLTAEKLIKIRPKGNYLWQCHLPTRKGLVRTRLHCILTPCWTLYAKDQYPEINEAVELKKGDYRH